MNSKTKSGGGDSVGLARRRGQALERRAMRVLRPAGETREELRDAYRSLAKRHHPDAAGGSARHFQLVREAYALLVFGELKAPSLLEDDELVMEVAHYRPEPLRGEEAMRDYAHQARDQFFWDW